MVEDAGLHFVEFATVTDLVPKDIEVWLFDRLFVPRVLFAKKSASQKSAGGKNSSIGSSSIFFHATQAGSSHFRTISSSSTWI